MSTEESPSFKLVLTSTLSKLGLKIAPMPLEIKEPVALVILLMSDDLICSESSAVAFKEKPNDIVKIELSKTLDTLLLDNFIKNLSKKDLIIYKDIYI